MEISSVLPDILEVVPCPVCGGGDDDEAIKEADCPKDLRREKIIEIFGSYSDPMLRLQRHFQMLELGDPMERPGAGFPSFEWPGRLSRAVGIARLPVTDRPGQTLIAAKKP